MFPRPRVFYKKVQRALCGLLLVFFLAALPVRAQQATWPGGRDEAEASGFGLALALAGGEAFIGEPPNVLGPGAVYVFEEADDAWTERQRLAASDATVADAFGWSVVAEGDVLLVGAPAQDGRRGAAYVFRKDAASGRWVEEALLTPQAATAGDELGRAVALRGDVALVGAPFASGQTGAAYLFRYDAAGGGWHEEARLTAADGMPSDRFGATLVFIDDEDAIIGAYGRANGTGAAYVFRQEDGTGAWRQQAILLGSDPAENDVFSFSMAAQGDELLLGAPQQSSLTGAVYRFRKNASTGDWEEQEKRVGSGLQSGDRFGWSMDLSGDALWIAAPFSNGRTGAVYVFRRDSPAGVWREREQVTSSTASSFAAFGRAVALDGEQALSGSSSEDFGTGAAYVFTRDAASETWIEQARLIGSYAGPEAVVGEAVACAAGSASLFPCSGIDLLAFLPTHALGGVRGAGANDIWGWTDPETGKEYALVGRTDGTSFVDVSDPIHPVYLGTLPTGTVVSTWRDIKTYAGHAFIVADGALNHGMQIFDLTQLRGVTAAPVTFSETAHYAGVNSAHNLAVNEETGFAYIVGAGGGGQTCGGGLHMVDIRDPLQPVFAGCFADPSTGRSRTGYTHDVQCVIYHGPDEVYEGRELCFGSNENAVSIADVTDKHNPVALAAATYPNVGYTHQGWLTEDHRYFFLDDELDEFSSGGRTRTLVWDVTDLDDPQLFLEHEGATTSSDHNQYVVGDYVFQSNYAGGLRILDITNIAAPREVAYFDVYPADDAPSFSGSWSNYPFFKSGTVIVTGREAGLFIVRPTGVQVATEVQEVPEGFTLSPAFPNPFNPATTLILALPRAQPVTVSVYDLLGRAVAVLHRGWLEAGSHRLVFSGEGLPSGTYVVRAVGATASRTQPVTLMK